MRVHRLTARRLVLAAAILVATAVAFAWFFPSSSYLFVPNEAQPLASHVEVENGTEPAGNGSIYFVDVTVRKASLVERLISALRPNGATIVSRQALLPEGSSFEDRREHARDEMERSQEVAAAVALEEAGLDVKAKPRGTLVEGVAPDVPAAEVLEEGDVIVAVNGVGVSTPAELRREVGKSAAGEEIDLTVRRDGRTRALAVETVPAPDEPTRAIIGIHVAQEADIELPLDVEIDMGAVGGPSAGLAFALQILQELGRDVDRGYRVAATGELELDGSVAPVGGIKQKTFGAREADADVFLVPAGDNGTEAARYADGLRVIPVESFQQALQKLATLPEKS
jgi:PDZ domain-containing protein